MHSEAVEQESLEYRNRALRARLRILELVDAGHPLPEILREICFLVQSSGPSVICAIVVLNDEFPGAPWLISPSLPSPLVQALSQRMQHVSSTTPADLDLSARRRQILEALSRLLPDYAYDQFRIAPFGSAGRDPSTGFVALLHEDKDVVASHPDSDGARVLALASELVHLALTSLEHTSSQDAVSEPLTDVIESAEAWPAVTYIQYAGDTISTRFLSPKIKDLVGWQPAEFLPHQAHWFARVHPDDQSRVAAAVALSLASGDPLDTCYRVQTHSGHEVWLRDMATRREIAADGAQVWCGMLIDVSADKATEAQLQSMAFYDSLTGLPNRRLVMDRLLRLLSDPQAPRATLLFLDLDGFKFINDGIGHAAGDELLVAVSRRLTAHLAGTGSLARFGGDEFVVVLDEATTSEAQAVAEALLDALRSPFIIDGFDLNVDGSIGIASASPDLVTPEALLRAADRALYRAKAGGRGEFAFFDPHVDLQGPDRQEFEMALRRAMAAGEFDIAYQPIVDIATRQISSLEALVRWRHPERGVLAAAEFIPLADETGLIVPLGRWVIQTACQQLKTWQEQNPGFQGLQVSVNLSGRQLRHPSLASDVVDALRRSGLRPESLALEVKEADLLTGSAGVAETVNQLSKIGVKVTIDEFGSGLAALDTFTRVTIDHLKLDGAWVSRLGQEPQDDAVRGLVGMARAIGLHVTARGVENGQQLAALQALGCQRAQGHFLAPPLPASELEALLKVDQATESQQQGHPRLR